MALTTIDDRGLKTPIDLLDNEKIRFGTGNDLEVYHAGTYTKLVNKTGQLRIQSADFRVRDYTNDHEMITAAEDGAVELYCDNVKKLETKSDGAKVTGQLEITTGSNSFLTSANVFKGTAGQKGVYLRSALSAEDTPSYASVDDTNTGMFLPGSDVCGFTTGGTEKLRITSAGEVVINDTSAVASALFGIKVDPSSHNGIGFKPTSNGSFGALRTLNAAGSEVCNIQYDTTNANINFRTSNTQKATITSAGNVGIGSDIPAEKLDVRGAIQCLNELRSTSGNDLLLNAGSANRDVKIQVNDANMIFVQGSTSRISIGGASNDPPGTPDGNLHVQDASAGTVTADADADELVLESSDKTGLSILSPGTGESSIYFGNPGTNGQKDGWIKYYHESHSTTAKRRSIQFRAKNEEICYINEIGLVLANDKGISFINADDTATGETVSSSVLDDYEEGSWTPTITGLGGHTTNAGSTWGKYQKVGNTVTIHWKYQWTSRNTTNGSTVYLASLPFTCNNNQRGTVCVSGIEGVISASDGSRTHYGGSVVLNTSTICFRASGHDVSENSLYGNNSTSLGAGYIYGHAIYEV